MKIICVLGGAGSTFVLESLDKVNYHPIFFNMIDPYPYKMRLEKHPSLLMLLYHLTLRAIGGYKPSLKVLKRPDSFWTDWKFHPEGIYNPGCPEFQEHLNKHRDYLVDMRHKRSACLKFSANDINTNSITSLVESYIQTMKRIESENNFTIVLLSNHWGEYGIFKELEMEAIYLIRDPINSLISHSKEIRHQEDYKKRGPKHINTKEWIDCYLSGPSQCWINHSKFALEQKNATIVRYNHFVSDWKKIKGLPDISSKFVYRENDVHRVLTKESILYIYEKTKDICQSLEFDIEKYL